MAMPDLTTAILVGALIGLLFVALGYAQLVWLTRQRDPRDPSQARHASPFRAWLAVALLVGAGILLVRAVSSSELPERQAFLVGEDLVSVRARPGLVARFEPTAADVRRGDPLVRFTGQDGQEPHLAVQSRRKVLQTELEIERARPLELDPELVRRVDQTRAALNEREQRLKQLVSERDAITRERTEQRLAIANRRFQIEQDDRAAARELKPLRATRDTEASAVRSQESLVREGLIAEIDAARSRDALTELEGRIGQLEDQRALLARERVELDALRSQAEAAFAQQIRSRTAEIALLTAEIERAREAHQLALEALEQDKPRALAQRDKRLRQIAVQIEECDTLLGDSERHLTFEAPFDGRIGFREPSPASTPADNGPLLVLYQPGKIAAAVRVPAGELPSDLSSLSAVIELPPAAGAAPAAVAARLPAAVTRSLELAGGERELHVACDPPDRVVRQLAMGGTVPVVVRLRQSVTSTASFFLASAAAAAALALVAYGALRQRRERRSARPGTGLPLAPHPALGAPTAALAPAAAPGELRVCAPRREGMDAGSAAEVVALVLGALDAMHQRGGAPGPLGPPPAGEPPAPAPLLAAPRLTPGLAQVVEAPSLLPPAHRLPAEAPLSADPLHPEDRALLRHMGAALRSQLACGRVATALVHRIGEALSRGGDSAAACVSAGFGAVVDERAVERAGMALLSAAGAGDLAGAARDCAELLQVMRAISSERMAPALDRVQEALFNAALNAARASMPDRGPHHRPDPPQVGV